MRVFSYWSYGDYEFFDLPRSFIFDLGSESMQKLKAYLLVCLYTAIFSVFYSISRPNLEFYYF